HSGQRGRGRGGGCRPGRDGVQGGRSRRLCRRGGRLCRGAGDAGGPSGQAARFDRLQDRRGHDAAGHDGALPAAPDLQGGPGHHHAAARRRRRHRSDRSAVAKHLGATIIGTAGSQDKVKLAKEAGCTHVINYKTEDFVKRTRELTGGQGVDVVYDGVGKDTYPASLDCLKPLGLFVSFGNASGSVQNFDLLALMNKGSLYATRPTLQTYVAKRADLVANAAELFDVVSKGIVKI